MTPHNDQAVREALAEIPTNWLDPLLTGPESVFNGKAPGTWGCPEVEELLRRIKARVSARLSPPEGVSEYDRAIEALAPYLPDGWVGCNASGALYWFENHPILVNGTWIRGEGLGGKENIYLPIFPSSPDTAASLREIRSGKVVRGAV